MLYASAGLGMLLPVESLYIMSYIYVPPILPKGLLTQCPDSLPNGECPNKTGYFSCVSIYVVSLQARFCTLLFSVLNYTVQFLVFVLAFKR